ncbi:MAG: outer membrane protein OmpA-like peptidoglycan-associated protein [Paraglaciecola sp.]|jgi:outer membrane protein OmpA-like peptidoglycan-associated protein/tetratricopeptide (TPR) repeat protein
MNLQKLIFGGLFLFLNISLFGQNKALQKANELYKASHFTEAAELYEVFLQTKDNLSTKTKLANCYRMNNRLDKAEELYAKIVVEDKAKSDTYFYYGEVLMGNEKYDEAKEWFLKFNRLEPDDARGLLMAKACDEVKTIKPFFPYLRVTEFEHNSDADDSTPVFWKEGIVFSSDRKMGLKLMKEKSGWTGRDYLNLYLSDNEDNSSFNSPKLFSIKLNELNKNTGNPTFVRDGSTIFFTRNDSETSKNGTYNMQLFTAESAGENRWKTSKKLKFCSSEYNYMHPAVSPDGTWMVFVSDKKGVGGTDLWMVKKKGEEWGRPALLSELINTVSHEGFPFIDEEGKLFFCSKGHVGYGGFDVFVTRRNEDGTWQKPINLGRPINSASDDISIALDGEKRRGLFSSNRIGGDDDIFLFEAVDSREKAGFFTNERPSVLSELPEVIEAIPAEAQVEKVKIKAVGKSSKKGKTKEKEAPKKEENTPDFSNQNSRTNIGNTIETTESIDLKKTLKSDALALKDLTNLLETNALSIGQIFRLENAVYDFQVYQITPKIVATLRDVANLLKENPNLKIELSAHTDSYGTAAANMTLSRNRAVNVAIYLYSQGISNQQLVTKAYGEMQLLNHCKDDVDCSMPEHLENQRMEVTILGF